ncbi:MAG TPA: copper resistance protein B [Frateuria sp.]|jgi:copper resistance protein B|uniref:copper resistance protein B n=1 Tax=Frateuria sp. TaxID=2211372 RepID=UPI002D7E5E88|nr:copper resistance protein B [Frateuria sp.]HET6806267.1 copper resistance protein B [Frateuria sp.]
MRRLSLLSLKHLARVAILFPWLALAVHAQDVPAPASSTSSDAGMDMGNMPGMAMPAPATTATPPASAATVASPPPAGTMNGMHDMDHGSMQNMDHGSMQGMDHGSMQGMDHGSMQGMDHSSMQRMDHSSMQGQDHGSMQGMDHSSMQGMTMGPMQGGSPPADARDPDYSAGVGYGPHGGIHEAMDDNASFTKILVDQLEAFNGKDGNGQRWEMQAYYGNDYDKLWLRTEGERSGGKLEEGDIETFWNHAIAPFWSTQLGVRSEAGEGPNRQWAAFGIEGLAPYWFELEATGYVGPAGRTAARFRAEYELLFTQRLILQPEFEANAYGKDDPARHLGSGLSDASIGLRLRYEFHRQFAPYVGVVWTRRFGGTADFARQDGQGLFDRQWVAGVRIWF